jgi:hypothetical protein
MNNRKVNQNQRSEEGRVREELERLLQQDTRDITMLSQEVQNLLPAKNGNFLDYHTVKAQSDIASRDIVDAISEFYLDAESIERISYVKQKTNVDKITVSNLLFQMKTAEHAIIKLLEEIDNGNLHPRTFEVLASLQRSKMEIVKHLAQFMIIMEGNYKNLRDDYRFKKAENTIEGEVEIQNTEQNKFRGTRHLIETLREAIPEKRTNEKDLNDGTGEGMDN